MEDGFDVHYLSSWLGYEYFGPTNAVSDFKIVLKHSVFISLVDTN